MPWCARSCRQREVARSATVVDSRRVMAYLRARKSATTISLLTFSAMCLPKDIVSPDRSTLNIADRNGFSGILLRAIPDDRTALSRQPYKREKSNLDTG